jgi:phytoene/squalene synthetase
MLNKKYRNPIYSIYGFVRYADETVDTFFNYPQEEMLNELIADTWKAIDRGISINPILDSFQIVVNQYKIEREHISSFFESMKMDLTLSQHDPVSIKTYIYGSAEVIGMMCLRIFYQDDNRQYEILKPYARKLGEIFQKVNFLRDIRCDLKTRGRIYFPEVTTSGFTTEVKRRIENEISEDFKEGYQGIRMLKKESRLGVYLAYIYYKKLFLKIQKASPDTLMKRRVRVHNFYKIYLLFQAYIKNSTNLI